MHISVNRRLKFISLVFFICILFSCSESEQDKIDLPILKKSEYEVWLENLNSKQIRFDTLYQSNAYLLTNNELKIGASQIRDFYFSQLNNWEKVKSIKTIFSKTDINNTNVKLEIGEFSTGDNKSFKNLTIWSKMQFGFKREFEVISENSDITQVDVDLAALRERWINFSNSRNVILFLQNNYVPHSIYYLNRNNTLYQSNELIDAFSYMENANWMMNTLTPYFTEVVNNNTIYEIGKYDGSGGIGDYVLIWQKDEEGIWSVVFDSNY